MASETTQLSPKNASYKLVLSQTAQLSVISAPSRSGPSGPPKSSRNRLPGAVFALPPAPGSPWSSPSDLWPICKFTRRMFRNLFPEMSGKSECPPNHTFPVAALRPCFPFFNCEVLKCRRVADDHVSLLVRSCCLGQRSAQCCQLWIT